MFKYKHECLVLIFTFIVPTISLSQGETSSAPGKVINTFRIPPAIEAMNGIAWDGHALWAVDYRDSGSNIYFDYIKRIIPGIFTSSENKQEGAKAYQLDFTNVPEQGVPAIGQTLNLGFPKMEGLAHDLNSTLFIGARTEGSRESAKIIAASTCSGDALYELTDYTWPDGEKHGTYSDPDGLAFGDDLIFWSVNAGHSDVTRAAVQVMLTSGQIVKRFWLPDEAVNDIAYGFGYLIYKPVAENVINLLKIDEIQDAQVAEIKRSFAIYDAETSGHWGLAYDNEQYLYLSQDAPGGLIWRIYLPKSVFE